MWLLVMFDLPVVEKEDRVAATRFRTFLLDEGFHMAQYSVYYRLLSGKDAASTMEKKIEQKIPQRGSVHILSVTDKQYENMRTFEGKRRENTKKPEQLILF